MAGFIKLRFTADEAGVSIALLALLALVVVERANASKPRTTAEAQSEPISIPSEGGINRVVIRKLDSALASLEHKLATL